MSPGCVWLLNLWFLHYPAVPLLGLAFTTCLLTVGWRNEWLFPAFVSCHWGQRPQALRQVPAAVTSAGLWAGGLMTPAAFSPVSSFLSSACAERKGYQFYPLCPHLWHFLKNNSWCEEVNLFRPWVQPSHWPWGTAVSNPVNICQWQKRKKDRMNKGLASVQFLLCSTRKASLLIRVGAGVFARLGAKGFITLPLWNWLDPRPVWKFLVWRE